MTTTEPTPVLAITCPGWCRISEDEHRADLEGWDGRVIHQSDYADDWAISQITTLDGQPWPEPGEPAIALMDGDKVTTLEDAEARARSLLAMVTRARESLPVALPDPDDEWLPHPNHCPTWCDGQHAQSVIEGCGYAESRTHIGYGGSEFLHEIRTSGREGRILRPGDTEWEMQIEQEPLERGGFRTTEVINLTTIESHDYPSVRTNLRLTPPEARSLARHLVHLADRVELR